MPSLACTPAACAALVLLCMHADLAGEGTSAQALGIRVPPGLSVSSIAAAVGQDVRVPTIDGDASFRTLPCRDISVCCPCRNTPCTEHVTWKSQQNLSGSLWQ